MFLHYAINNMNGMSRQRDGSRSSADTGPHKNTKTMDFWDVFTLVRCSTSSPPTCVYNLSHFLAVCFWHCSNMCCGWHVLKYLSTCFSNRVGDETQLFLYPSFSTVKYDKIWALWRKKLKKVGKSFPNQHFLMASSYVKWKSQCAPNIVE